MQIEAIIKAAIPAGLRDHVLWGRTPFPFKPLTAKDVYRAAQRLKRATDAGNRLCDCCDRVATNGYLCGLCRAALDRVRMI